MEEEMNFSIVSKHSIIVGVPVSCLKAVSVILTLLLFIFPFQHAWGARFSECNGCISDFPNPSPICWDHKSIKFRNGPIVFELQRRNFPDGSAEATALRNAADRWNALTNVQLVTVGSSATTISYGNSTNEVGFDRSYFTGQSPGAAATSRVLDFSTCEFSEADIAWNPDVSFHASEDSQHSPYVGDSANMVAVALPSLDMHWDWSTNLMFTTLWGLPTLT
jgi:hypothetical protein